MPKAVQTWLLAALAAAASALTFSPFNWWFLVPVAPACIAWLAERPTRAAPWALWACSLITWLWWERWIMDVSVAGYVPLALYGSLYTPIAWWLAERLRRRNPAIPLALVTALALVGAEWLRGVVVMNGYPWYLAGSPLVDFTAVAQAADIFGPSWGTVVAAAVGGAGAGWVLRRERRTASIVAAALVLACLYGAQQVAALPGGVRVLLVQTNLPTSNKLAWSRQGQIDDFSEFCRQTIAGAADQAESGTPIDLAVWPETMLPGFGLEPDTLAMLESGPYWPGRHFADGISATQRVVRAPLLVGSGSYLGLRTAGEFWEWDRHFNSAYLLRDGYPPQRADKVFLTPFGETMPYISSWKWLEERLLDFGAAGMKFDLDSGAESERFAILSPDVGFRFATPICFEDTVASACRTLAYPNRRKDIDALINLSNDGWFGVDDDGRADHELLARWRCIELRVPMARCANTGRSSFIDSRGVVVGQAPPRVATTLTSVMLRDRRSSIYGFTGDLLSPALSLAAAGLCLWKRR